MIDSIMSSLGVGSLQQFKTEPVTGGGLVGGVIFVGLLGGVLFFLRRRFFVEMSVAVWWKLDEDGDALDELDFHRDKAA